MVQFATKQITPRIVRIDGILHERMYLIQGDVCAALVDTGTGFGSLAALVRRLTHKPVRVFLTHGHVDHAMGAGEFPTVYMSRRDHEVYRRHTPPAVRRDLLARSRHDAQVTEADMVPADDPTRFLNLDEGDCFDLGGVHLDVFACPGHTPGSLVFLAREERILLVGDACSNFTFLADPQSLSVPDYEESLKRLKPKVEGAFDRVLEAHGTGELPVNILDGLITLCEDIRRGHTDNVPCEYVGNKGVLAKARIPHTTSRTDGGVGNIFYVPKHAVYQ